MAVSTVEGSVVNQFVWNSSWSNPLVLSFSQSILASSKPRWPHVELIDCLNKANRWESLHEQCDCWKLVWEMLIGACLYRTRTLWSSLAFCANSLVFLKISKCTLFSEIFGRRLVHWVKKCRKFSGLLCRLILELLVPNSLIVFLQHNYWS